MTTRRIRPATDTDLPAIVGIYNHWVETSHVTFDTRPFSVHERRAWFAAFDPSGPHRILVADDGEVSGYAFSHPLRPKPAYATSVETSIYLDPDRVGGGIGSALYGQLLRELESLPTLHRAFAGMALPNPASASLHERLGYRCLGVFEEVGHKFGRYWDVAWYTRELAS